MKIRNAAITDLSVIVKIYNASIPGRMATADTEPVTVKSRQHWFDEHSSIRPLWVMESEEAIAGWLSFQSFYGRPAYHSTAELSVYVSPVYRRQGVGTRLLEQAIEQSPTLNLKTLIAFIFAHNQPSLKLFDRFNFERWGYLPKVAELDDIERDLMIMGRRIAQ